MKRVWIGLMLCINVIWANEAYEIAKKSYDVMYGYKSSISMVDMVLINAQGSENQRKFELKKLEGDDGDKSLLTFVYPIDVKDTKLLSFEHIGTDDDQWLYLPELKRTKRILSKNKSGSFMGSEFSYEDISSQNYKKYDYIAEVKEESYEGTQCFVIQRIPIDKNSAYSKQIVYVDKKTYLAKYGEYFDKQNKLLKKISFLEYSKLSNIYRVKKIDMLNVQTNKRTTLIYTEDKINQNLSENDFSQRVLQ